MKNYKLDEIKAALKEREEKNRLLKTGPFRRVVKFIRYTTSAGNYEIRWQRQTLSGKWVDCERHDPVPDTTIGYPLMRI